MWAEVGRGCGERGADLSRSGQGPACAGPHRPCEGFGFNLGAAGSTECSPVSGTAMLRARAEDQALFLVLTTHEGLLLFAAGFTRGEAEAPS